MKAKPITVEPQDLSTARIVLDVDYKAVKWLPPITIPWSVEIKEWRERRSLTANSYMWVLCDEIAKSIQSTKEDVYRKAVQEVGVFDPISVTLEAIDRFKERWESNGIGWAVVDSGYRNAGRAYLMAYYGSSTYNSKEMARLIDYLVDEAQELGIDTMPPAERKALLDAMERKN